MEPCNVTTASTSHGLPPADDRTCHHPRCCPWVRDCRVRVAGWALDRNESIGSLITKFPGSLIGPATTIGRPYPLHDGSQGTDLYLTRHGVATAFAADVSPAVQEQIFATQRPFSVDAFNSKSGAPAWKTITMGDCPGRS